MVAARWRNNGNFTESSGHRACASLAVDRHISISNSTSNMKKQILLLLGWVLGMQVVVGQKGDDDNCKAPEQCDVVYDFAAKKFTSLPTADFGSPILVRVENINTLLYEVEVKAKQVYFVSDRPEIVSSVFQIEDGSEDVAGNKEWMSYASNSDYQTEKGAIEDNLNKKKGELTAAREKPKIGKNVQLMDSLNAEVGELERQLDDLRRNEQKRFFQRSMETKADELRGWYGQLHRVVLLKNELILLASQNGKTAKETIAKVNEVDDLSDFDIVQLEQDFLAGLREFWGASRGLKSLGDQPGDSTDIDLYVARLEGAFKRTSFSEVFEEVITLRRILENEDNYLVVSDPVQAKGDAMVFAIKITARKGLDLPVPLDEREFEIEVSVCKGMKIDFSTGLMLTRWQQDRSYAVSEVGSDSAEIVKNRYYGFGLASLGGLMHISSRSEKVVNFAGTLGFGLNSKDITEANIFLGGSCIFGRREQFVVSTGLSLAQVDYLKGKYKLGAHYLKEDLSANDLTTKTMRPGLFVGFTYNLTKEKEE